MIVSYSDGEQFLLSFHAQKPGVTPRAFGALGVTFRGREFESSYHVLLEVLPRGGPLTVLDVGCGNGHLLAMLAKSWPELRLVGIDFSIDELRAASPIAATWLVAARAQNLPLSAASVDVVLSHLALMLMNDGAQVLREIARVLAPRGRLAAVVGGAPQQSPALDAYLNILRRYLAAMPQPAVRFGDPAFRSEEGIRALLSRQFGDVVIEPLDFEERLTPQAAWAGLEDMYDLYHLATGDRQAIREEYLADLRAIANDEGFVTMRRQLRLVHCRRLGESEHIDGTCDSAPGLGPSLDL
jgi:SAM-dependent methyltransferase